eukprot:m.34886 g.34886  ORF g.34886 m.34886 type:complete len:400 (-) comp9965_c0_seq1:69-1268(-)
MSRKKGLAERRGFGHMFKLVSNSSDRGCPTPPPVRSLKQSLRSYNGGELKAMEDFVYNKERLLSATTLNPQSFERISVLAEGEGRYVELVRHKHTDLILVQKTIRYERESHALLKRELDLLHECHSPEIVNFYGSYFHNNNVNILLEYMNGGCLDDVMRRIGRIDELPLAFIIKKVLHGLIYLDEEKIMHRDLKPANILVNTRGDIKLCDFGVSKKLLTLKKANTFVGTFAYMAPERLQADEYNVKSDIWSLGVLLMELATGTYPFSRSYDGDIVPMVKKREPVVGKKSAKRIELAFMDVLSAVTAKKLPKLPQKRFSEPFEQFVHLCLRVKPKDRADLPDLLTHEWVLQMTSAFYDMGEWVRGTIAPEELAMLPNIADEGEDEDEIFEELERFNPDNM